MISLGAKGAPIGEGRCPSRSGDADQPTVSRRRVADGCNQCSGDIVSVIPDNTDINALRGLSYALTVIEQAIEQEYNNSRAIISIGREAGS